MTPGLVRVPTPLLARLLRLVHRGELPCPITPVGIVTHRLQDVADDIDLLRGLDERAVRAVLVAVIAERRALTPGATP